MSRSLVQRTPALVAAITLALLAIPSTDAAAEPAVGYKPGGGFTLLDGEDFTMQVIGRVQARHTYLDQDHDRMTDAPWSLGKGFYEDVSTFTPERVRIGVKGSLFRVWKYEAEVDFGKGKAELKKGYIAWTKHDAANVEMGQFNVKFDRSQYTSSAKQMFVDRSIAASRFGTEYDVGVDLAGDVAEKRVQYNVGVFEGEKTKGANVNDGHSVVARLSFNPNGDFGVSEGDIKKTDKHLWFIDVAGLWNSDSWSDGDGDGKEDDSELTDTASYVFGFGYRHAGVYLQGEHYWEDKEKDDGTGMVDADGWYLQVGVMLVKDKWEIAARYSDVDPHDDVEHDSQTEFTLGLNRYLHGVGHSLKLQGDLSWLSEEMGAGVADLDDLRLRLQGQIVF